MATLYNPKDITLLTQVSPSALRNYTMTYAKYFSTEATGKVRKFTEADLRLIAFIRNRHLVGDKQPEVIEALENKELDAFNWEPVQAEATGDTSQQMLVPVERLQAALAVLEETRRRELAMQAEAQRRDAEAREREKAMQQRIEELQRELGKAEGELSSFRARQRKPPRWWVKVFGGE